MLYAGSSSRHHDPSDSPYAMTKFLGEEICKLYRKTYNVNVEIARFYNVYGPYEPLDEKFGNVIGIWRVKANKQLPLPIVGDGQQRRDFTHVYDIVKGLIKIDSLKDYCVDGSPLEINVSDRLAPFVEATCGSLGQGLSVAIGMALSAKRRKLNSRFYIILGDGELQEGQTWEAILSASSWKIDNLCLVVDYNNMQVEGSVDQVMSLEPLIDKFISFGWNTINCNGNKITELLDSCLLYTSDAADE